MTTNSVSPVSAEDFCAAMRQVVSPVTIITTDGPAGRFGKTVSAVMSLSAEPPSVLVSVYADCDSARAIRRNGCFCVNVLSGTQQDMSDAFAGRGGFDQAGRFALGRWLGLETGAPALEDAATVMDCRLAGEQGFGTHAMFTGLILATRIAAVTPLAYHDRAYADPQRRAA